MTQHPVKSKREAARRRAVKMLDDMPLVSGHKANPSGMKLLDDDLDEEAEALYVQAYKMIDCVAYDTCSMVACLHDWDDLSCRACPVYKQNQTKIRLIRKIRKSTVFRLIRKIRKWDHD